MEKVIFQIKYNDKTYNKFILLAKEKKVKTDEKTGKVIEEITEYKVKELLANKEIHIEYYNKLFIEGDFDNTMSKVELSKVIEFMKKHIIVDYINTDFEEINKIL